MGEQRGERVLGGLPRLLLVGLLTLGCGGGGQAELGPNAQKPAVGRPDGVSGGPRVGVVVIASKDVRVQPSRGAAFPAQQGVMLVRDDRLVTAADPGSFVVVELYNGHLVRFNQATETVIEKIAVFDAPRAGDDLAKRFEKVLRPEELGDDRMRGAISRVAGWNSRMTAAETIAVLPAERLDASPPPPPARDGKAESKAEQSRGNLEPESAPAPEDAPGPEDSTAPLADPQANKLPTGRTPPSKSDRLDEDDGVGSHGKASKRAEEPDTEESKKSSEGDKPRTPGDVDDGAGLDLPESVHFKPEKGAARTVKLPLALAMEREQLAGCAGRGAQLRAHVVKGLIKEIVVDNGRKCSLETSRALTLEDGWLEMRVK